jgi:hypothetical protein
MSRKLALGGALRATLSFAAPAHESSKQCRDEPKKWPTLGGTRPGLKRTFAFGRIARFGKLSKEPPALSDPALVVTHPA